MLLALTTAQMAMARAGMSAHGMMLLCSGGAVISLPLGADGQPQETAHFCPDCTIGALVHLGNPGLAPAPETAARLQRLILTKRQAPRSAFRASARAPPLLSA